MPFKVIVQGKEYPLDEETKNTMEFFNEAEALEKINADEPLEITTIDENTWKQILKLCKIVNNKFPEIVKIRTSDPRQVLNHELADELKALLEKSPEDFNKTYGAAHLLKITNLRKAIAAVLACKVYIKPTLNDYNKKRQELKITKNLTAEDSRKMKERYTFMN